MWANKVNIVEDSQQNGYNGMCSAKDCDVKVFFFFFFFFAKENGGLAERQ